MQINNFIESQLREVDIDKSPEFENLYLNIKDFKLRTLFSVLHHDFVYLFKSMNDRLPTNHYGAHFWADPSRELIKTIDITTSLQRALKKSEHAFSVDPYYDDLIKKCSTFLSNSGGSLIPPNMEKITLYYTIPIFKLQNTIKVDNDPTERVFQLTLIGEGSYAYVHKYYDDHYERLFAFKRAKEDLTVKELTRFKQEFEQMKDLSSPYILDVYSYKKNAYIMEFMDYSLHDFIEKNNNTISMSKRRNITNQVLKAFSYIHSKGLLHRDINPKNVLIKTYDDSLVVKISDFGLVKTPNSNLTSVNTEFKGYFNDPELMTQGFDTYSMVHETYALTRLIYYILTGRTKTRISDIKDQKHKSFIEKGLSSDKAMRFKSTDELIVICRDLFS